MACDEAYAARAQQERDEWRESCARREKQERLDASAKACGYADHDHRVDECHAKQKMRQIAKDERAAMWEAEKRSSSAESSWSAKSFSSAEASCARLHLEYGCQLRALEQKLAAERAENESLKKKLERAEARIARGF